MTLSRARLSRRFRRTVGLLLCILSVAPVTAQGRQEPRLPSGGAVGHMPAYCSCVQVEKMQLTNAAIVTIKADGLTKTTAKRMDFVEEDEPGEYDTKAITRFPLRIENARSQLGSFVDINLYPISHLEITIPPDAKEGIGLELTVVLFTPGYARLIDLTDFEYYGRLDYTGSGAGQDVPVEILMSEDQRAIIVIARSDRYIDVERERQAQRIWAPRARLSVGYENDLLFVHAVGVTAAQLLDEIGNQTGKKISLPEASPAVASMHLEGMTLQDALKSIARAYGLVVGRIDGAYALAPGWPTSGAPYRFSAQRSFPMRYLRAEEAADLLPNALDRYTQIDRDHNAIVATGAPELLEKIGADLAVIDKPPPLIEAQAIVVDTARDYDLIRELNLQLAGGTTSLAWASGTGDINFRIVRDPPQRVRAALLAMEQRGIVKTRAQARVTAKNGEYARLFSGMLQYFPFKTTPGRGRRQEIALQKAEVGVRLSGWFHTSGTGAILSHLYLRANNIVSVSPEGLPLVATRYAQTRLQLADGDTIYVGGLTVTQNETRHTKVPVCGDLPLLGALFRSSHEAVNERSLAVFLTLRIADDASAAARRRATAYADLVSAAHWLDPGNIRPELEARLSR